MPNQIIRIEDAYANLRTNDYALWGKGATSNDAGSDPNCASARVHKDHILIKTQNTTKRLTPGSSIFAMGSCFAREIEVALAAHGFNILSRPKETRFVSGYRHDGRAEFELLNRYNTASMLLEFRRILDDRGCLPDDALLIPDNDQKYLEAHYHSIGSSTLHEIAERRLRFWNDFQDIRKSDAIVITLGVNEAPFDPRSGLYRNVSPLVREMRRRVPIEVHTLSVQENVDSLREIRKLIRKNIPNEPLIFITVSPVPLTSTYTEDDVIIANTASKATLRVAAEEFCRENADVIYFPSYEMAMHADPCRVFTGDKRHIQKSFVSSIMKQFIGNYVEPCARETDLTVSDSSTPRDN